MADGGPDVVLRKLIEVAIPLQAINVASAREKSIRHGHRPADEGIGHRIAGRLQG